MIDERDIRSIFEIFRRNDPNPKSELDYINEYTFCVAVILSAQSTDRAVNLATPKLFEIASNPREMLELGEIELKEYIKTIGLYNNKAKNIIKLSYILETQYNSKLPNTRDELEKLPGIGRKSANVIMNQIFEMPYIAVDTHVLRLSNRLELSDSSNPIKVEEDLTKKIPLEFHIHASDWIVLHGRYICTAKNPKCQECCIRKYCPYIKKIIKIKD